MVRLSNHSFALVQTQGEGAVGSKRDMDARFLATYPKCIPGPEPGSICSHSGHINGREATADSSKISGLTLI